MPKISVLVAMAAGSLIAGLQCAHAGLLGMPMGLQSAIQHIKLDTPKLAPMAYTQFNWRVEDDCWPGMMVRSDLVRLTSERWDDPIEVNATVNQAIARTQ
jgi:predicted transglutaminase-like cysteine proteinase